MKTSSIPLAALLAVVCFGRADGALALYSTGVATPVGTAPVLLPEGSVDPHYVFTTTPPVPNQPDLFVAVSGLFPFPYWMANGPNSQWIEPISGTNSNDPPGSGYPLPGQDYYVTTTFDLTGYNPATASINFYVGSDNEVNVYLNGAYTGIDQGGFGGPLSGPFTISSGFVAGVNTLTFDLINYPQDSGNPAGLRVEYSAISASPVPEAGSLAVWSLVGLCAARATRRRKS